MVSERLFTANKNNTSPARIDSTISVILYDEVNFYKSKISLHEFPLKSISSQKLNIQEVLGLMVDKK